MSTSRHNNTMAHQAFNKAHSEGRLLTGQDFPAEMVKTCPNGTDALISFGDGSRLLVSLKGPTQ